jgi:cytoskeletal protein CcmA (bactofilin family)
MTSSPGSVRNDERFEGKAMFGKSEGTSPAPRATGGSNLSFIGREVTITGNVGGNGNLHVDGRIEGDVQAASITLGTDGVIRGNIAADSAQISGTVEGTVAAKTLTIEATARILGDLSYDAVSVASGAQVEGRVKRLTRESEPALKLIASE